MTERDNATLNTQVASKLEEYADLLGAKGADYFRVAAYRRAAEVVRSLPRDIVEVQKVEGRKGLRQLPGVGNGIAGAIEELIATGRWRALDRLHRELTPEQLFQAVAGVGPELAKAICVTLKISRLEDLEIAAHTGQLEGVPGIGPRRAATVRGALQSLLGRVRVIPTAAETPSVAEVLDVDTEYRSAVAAEVLPRIAPRRFNPLKEAWLPILETKRGKWQFTALFSNTPLAHRLEKTRSWVAITYRCGEHSAGQHTVITSGRKGILSGKRVIRAREQECRDYYSERARAAEGH